MQIFKNAQGLIDSNRKLEAKEQELTSTKEK